MSKGTGPLSKLYNVVINSADKVVPEFARPLWMAPAGPKTVFFWAPMFKWSLVLAGLGDLVNRPPQNISLNQCAVLATTGLIWSRYSVVIKPKNYSLLAVNIVVALNQGFLVYRALKWRNESAKNALYEHKNFPFLTADE